MRIIPEKMTTDEVIRTCFCLVLLVILACFTVMMVAKIRGAEDPISRTERPVSYSTRCDHGGR